jgi:hypothetical protein
MNALIKNETSTDLQHPQLPAAKFRQNTPMGAYGRHQQTTSLRLTDWATPYLPNRQLSTGGL